MAPVDPFTQIIQTARAHTIAGRRAEASSLIDGVLAKAPNHAEALYIKGHLLSGDGKLNEAAATLERAARVQPSSLDILSALALALRQCGRLQDSIAAFRRLCAAKPDDAQVHYETAFTLYMTVESIFDGMDIAASEADISRVAIALDEMRQLMQRALKLNPALAMAQLGIVYSYLGANRTFEALQAGLIYARLKPDDAAFIECMKDLPLRLMLEKTLRARPGYGQSPDVAPPPVTARDDWERQATTTIRDAIPNPISGPAIVYFHVAIGDRHPFLGVNEKGAPAVDYLTTLALSCRSARLNQPGAKIVLLTDSDTSVVGFSGADFIIRLPRERDHLMYARMRACRALVASGQLAGPVLFLDTDVCINRDFSPVFDGSFDIALSYRSNIRFPLMPVNEGVMLGDARRPGALAAFFANCLDDYEWLADQPQVRDRYGFDVRFWRGGQLALAAFVEWRTPPNTLANVRIGSIRCKFLPCDAYNFAVTPDTPFESLDRVWSLHFKGLLPKARMEQYLVHAERRANPAY